MRLTTHGRRITLYRYRFIGPAPFTTTPLRMTLSALQAVIFDFDLTLVDSSEAIVECTQFGLARMGCASATPEQIRSFIGLPLSFMFRELSGDESDERAAAFSRHFVARADEIMVQSTRIYPEVPALLTELRQAGLSVAVVSTKFRYRIEDILTANGLRAQIDVIVGGEDVQRHKPDPEGIAQALQRLGITPEQAIYVGDHDVDAKAAAGAGTGFIGVVSGTTSFDAWSQAGKNAVRQHVGEVAAMVREIGIVGTGRVMSR